MTIFNHHLKQASMMTYFSHVNLYPVMKNFLVEKLLSCDHYLFGKWQVIYCIRKLFVSLLRISSRDYKFQSYKLKSNNKNFKLKITCVREPFVRQCII